MRRLLLVQPGSWAGFFFPGQETLSLSLSWVSLGNISCWPCWTLPAREDACLYWVRANIHEQTYIYSNLQSLLHSPISFCTYAKFSYVSFFLDKLSSCTDFAFLTVREPEGGLKLYCKGADLVILQRLQKDYPYQERIERAMEVNWSFYWTIGVWSYRVYNLYDALLISFGFHFCIMQFKITLVMRICNTPVLVIFHFNFSSHISLLSLGLL